jgi:hypothetical protein
VKKQIELLRVLEELDMNLQDVNSPHYRKLGFQLPSVDFVKSAEARRQEICKRVEPKLLIQYERIRKRYGSRVVVQVISEFCGGCYVKLPSELALRRQVEVTTCPNCGRFLYNVR